MIQRILNFYLKSSLHVGLSIAAFSWLSFLQLKMAVDTFLLMYIFCASVVAYNFMKYAQHWIKDELFKLTFIKIITVISITGVLLCVFKIKYEVVVLSALLALLIYGYSYPVSKHIKKFRQTPLIKWLVITFIWATVSFIFPLLSVNASMAFDMILFEFVQRMVWVLALIIPFEIRDIEDDCQSGGSMIQRIGVMRAKIVSIILLILFFSLRNLIYTQISVVNLLIYISLIIMLLFTQKNQGRYYSSLMVESLPMLWLIFALCYKTAIKILSH